MHKLFRMRASKLPAVTAILLVAVMGSYFLMQSRAAGPVTTTEAEQGMTAGAVSKCQDGAASAGQAVYFGRTTCTSLAVPSGQMIAWGATSTGTYGYWHRLVRLPDGSWLRVFTVFPSDTRFELV
ncbi:MAG TPA: hypothetical protein VK978_04695, partial [Candidatus Saccharimonadales bacterium]|nr:hypothetical protein [Candidatus Saccharimonadales bacterium]